MSNVLHPCLWFDGKAQAAANFYCTVFPEAAITVNTPMVVNFELYGQKFMGLNGGPMFTINPSISLMVMCESVAETTAIWEKLIENGTIFMPLDTYGWSEKYGWVQDQFGVSWQIYTGSKADAAQKIVPTLMFTGAQCGKTETAIQFYTNIFKNSGIQGIMKYAPGEGDSEDLVKHAQFHLNGYTLMAMDSSADHAFAFNEAFSLVIDCETQEEIDFYWNALTEGGYESQCGWLKDQFGVSWQVVPKILGKLMSDSIRAPKVMQAFMKMKKFDIETLLKA